jgi:uncharacterized cupin superfamily protein
MPTVKNIIIRKPTEQETDVCQTWPTWSCGTSEFEWEYTQTEKCLIMEGQITISDCPDSGDTVSFGPGDYVEFPNSLKCVWKVTQPVRKHYTFE